MRQIFFGGSAEVRRWSRPLAQDRKLPPNDSSVIIFLGDLTEGQFNHVLSPTSATWRPASSKAAVIVQQPVGQIVQQPVAQFGEFLAQQGVATLIDGIADDLRTAPWPKYALD